MKKSEKISLGLALSVGAAMLYTSTTAPTETFIKCLYIGFPLFVVFASYGLRFTGRGALSAK